MHSNNSHSVSSFHTKGQFIDFCTHVFGPAQNFGKNIQVVCPICKILKEKQKRVPYTNRKLAIEVNTQVVHCWVCGYKSKSLYHLIKKYKSNHLKTYMEKFLDSEELNRIEEAISSNIKQERVSLPEDFVLLATGDASDPHVSAALAYLKARGIDSVEDLWYWRLGISHDDRKLSRRVIVPSFDHAGNLNYYSARAIQKNINPKYENSHSERENIIFNEINIDWNSPLVLVEGVFDLIKCDTNATAILGSELPGHFHLFQRIIENKTPIILALDPDAEKKSFEIAKRLCEFDISVKILEIDSSKFEDVGSMTKNDFSTLLQNAKEFNVEYMLRSRIKKII